MKLFIAIMNAIDKFDAFTKTDGGKIAIIIFGHAVMIWTLIKARKERKENE